MLWEVEEREGSSEKEKRKRQGRERKNMYIKKTEEKKLLLAPTYVIF